MLFIVRGDPFNSYSGTEILAGNLALELAKQGHSIRLVYEGRGSCKALTESVDGIETHNLHLIGIPFIRAVDFYRRCSNYCTKLIKESRIDAVIAFGAGTFSGHVFDRIKKLNSPLLIYYAMDSMIMEYERSKASNEAKGLFARFKWWIWYTALIRSDKTSCLSSDRILASSKDTANHLIADYGILPAKINILYEGVPDDFADDVDIVDPEVPTFLHIAGGPRKGTDFFLKAVKLLEVKYGLRAEAVIIRASQFNMNQAQALGVEAKAYSYISQLGLRRLYALCTGFVSPSLSEGFCLPVVEAATFGKPSVVTNTGSLPELVTNGENGFVIPVADVNALADRLHRIAINPELRRKMGDNARKCAENFTITNTASNLLKLINEFTH